MKKLMTLEDVRSLYRKAERLTEEKDDFHLYDAELNLVFVLPKAAYMLQNGDILDSMYKFSDTNGALLEYFGIYAQGAEMRYLFGRYEAAEIEGQPGLFYLPEFIDSCWDSEVTDVLVELVWNICDVGEISDFTMLMKAMKAEAFEPKPFSSSGDPYGVWQKRTIMLPIVPPTSEEGPAALDSFPLWRLSHMRQQQLVKVIKTADEKLKRFDQEKAVFEAEFRKLAACLETDKRKVSFDRDEMVVKCKIRPFESLILRYRYDATGKEMLLAKFPFLKTEEKALKDLRP